MKPDPLFEQRLNKLEQWKALGFEGYAEKFNRTHTSQAARKSIQQNPPRGAETIMNAPQSEVRMCGRIVAFREMGKLAFLKMRDGEGDFQICLAKNVLGELFKPISKSLDIGDFFGFVGEFFITKHGEPSLLATEVRPLSKALRPLPEKFHGIKDRESCYRQRYLDMIMNPETLNRFKTRSHIIREIRHFFHARGFYEVETRTLQPQAGGAMAKIFKTHHNALDHDFVLRIALELDLKTCTVGGLERVFEIGKCFRNEGMDPSHLQEFTMLEWYAAYADLEQNMTWTEELIQQIIHKVLGKTTIQILDANEQEVKIDFSTPYARKRFPDLLRKFTGIDMATITRDELEKIVVEKYQMPEEEATKTSRGNLLDHIYKKTARPTLIQPTFVTDYPSDLKPLARPNGDGTAICAQLLVGGWEITNAYGELIDPQVQRRLLEAQAKAKAGGDEEAMEVDEDFLRAMEHGMPPQTGFGIGIDRLVALLTEQLNLRDVILFPLMRPEQMEKTKDDLCPLCRKSATLQKDEHEHLEIICAECGSFKTSKDFHTALEKKELSRIQKTIQQRNKKNTHTILFNDPNQAQNNKYGFTIESLLKKGEEYLNS